MHTGVVPSFTKTSSEEVDTALETLRKSYIMPAYLSETQQNLVFRQKHSQMLKNDEVIANINGEKFRLEPLVQNLPNVKKAVHTITSKMEPKDLDNILPLLEGFVKARSSIPKSPVWTRRFVRLFGSAGREDLVLAYIRQSSDTGFVMANLETAGEIVRVFYRKAVKADWEAAETKKALSWCQNVFDLMDDPKHASSSPERDPRRSIQVLAPLLGLAAKRAQQPGGEVVKKNVEQYAARLLSLGKEELTLPAAEARLGHKHGWLRTRLVTYNSLESALEVLEPSTEVAIGLKEITSTLGTDLAAVYKELVASEWVATKEREGVSQYEVKFGKPDL